MAVPMGITAAKTRAGGLSFLEKRETSATQKKRRYFSHHQIQFASSLEILRYRCADIGGFFLSPLELCIKGDQFATEISIFLLLLFLPQGSQGYTSTAASQGRASVLWALLLRPLQDTRPGVLHSGHHAGTTRRKIRQARLKAS